MNGSGEMENSEERLRLQDDCGRGRFCTQLREMSGCEHGVILNCKVARRGSMHDALFMQTDALDMVCFGMHKAGGKDRTAAYFCKMKK